MNKSEFLRAVSSAAGAVAAHEREKMLEYYAEMIDDAMDEGLSEEEAVVRLGTWEEICAQIASFSAVSEDGTVIAAPVREDSSKHTKTEKRVRVSLPVWAVLLLILSAPLWLPLVLCGGLILLTLLLAVVLIPAVLLVSVIALGVVGVVGIPAAILLAFTTGGISVVFLIGGALFCIGLAILGWFLFGWCALLVKHLLCLLFGGFRRLFAK